MTTELLRLENICFGFTSASPLMTDVSFTLMPGGVFWVTGEAGTGKTTLLDIIIKERAPYSGQVFFRGRPVFGRQGYKRTELRRSIGVIFQENRLLPTRDVFENTALPLRIAGWGWARVSEPVMSALGEVGLLGKARSMVDSLSDTERRLLALARVLAKAPPLALADLNSCTVDMEVIAPHLARLASYGSGVLIFSRERKELLGHAQGHAAMALG